MGEKSSNVEGTTDDKTTDRKFLIIGLLVGVAMVLLWLGNWYVLRDHAKPGPFGDQFGAINALFSGLALAGVVLAIFMQRHELQLQRRELDETQELMEQQKFESMFFQMLRLHGDVVDSMYSRHLGNAKGREALWVFEKFFTDIVRKTSIPPDDEIARTAKLLFDHHRAQLDVGHYFRNMYQIVKFIDDRDDTVAKQRYANIVRAQMTHSEQVLLLYNCLSTYGNEKFKPLVNKYSLLEGVRPDPAHDKLRHLYDERAFDESIPLDQGVQP